MQGASATVEVRVFISNRRVMSSITEIRSGTSNFLFEGEKTLQGWHSKLISSPAATPEDAHPVCCTRLTDWFSLDIRDAGFISSFAEILYWFVLKEGLLWTDLRVRRGGCFCFKCLFLVSINMAGDVPTSCQECVGFVVTNAMSPVARNPSTATTSTIPSNSAHGS